MCGFKKSAILMRKVTAFVLGTAILAGVCPVTSGAQEAPAASASPNTGIAATYGDVLKTYDLTRDSAGRETDIPISAAKDSSGKTVVLSALMGKQVFRWDDSTDGIELPFTSEEGLYSISIEYAPLTETTSDIVRSIRIDGKTPFQEADSVKMKRMWVPGGKNTFDDNGDEQPAVLVQKQQLITQPVMDVYGLYSEPLLFKLGGGNHTLSLDYISGSVAIADVRLIPYKQTIRYSDYIAQHKDAKTYSGENIEVQGEDAAARSSRMLSPISVSDPAMTNYKLGVSLLNAIGGWNWRYGYDYISWTVTAPEDGLYKLAMRVRQNYNGIVTYRQIAVDGKVPFKEFEAVPFYAANGYATTVAGGDRPYLFYLTKGSHTLTMSAVTGQITQAVSGLQGLTTRISGIITQIQTITGVNPDVNFNYEIDKKIPSLLENLKSVAAGIREQADYLGKICGGNPPQAASLRSDADTILSMVKDPRSIPVRLSDLSTVGGNLASAISTLESMPLTVDYLELMSPDAKVVQKKAGLFSQIALAAVQFFKSFQMDYSGGQTAGEKDSRVLNVWVSSGQEWGKAIRQLSDEYFTPQTHIRVNINILPSGYTTIINGVSPLLLSIVSGNTPDVALGSDMDTPSELAIRGAAVDLGKMPDYAQIAKRFSPAAITPLTYNGGVYALPETMDFPLLIYRTDIFKSLGLKVPDTWEELWNYTLPKLKQINAGYYVNSSTASAVNMGKMSNFATFLFQNGGDFYSANNKMCTLDSDAAFAGFSNWTKNFIQYQTPQYANLYSEMRTGSIPLAVGYLSDYLMLDVAAPELYGRFDIAAIPGTKDKNGNILRYGAGSVTSSLMFQNSRMQSEGWEFLKWWTSDETQERFASQIEAAVGPEGRWFSANLNAFFSLPWGRERTKTVKDWISKWYKNPYNVLGGYMTQRAVNNAWTRTVLSGMNIRDSFEQAYNEIAIEMQRKQQEYGVK